MKTITAILPWLSSTVLCLSAPAPVPAASAPSAGAKIIARIYNSGFPDGHDTYNGLSTAPNGKIYYVLSSERFDLGAQMYVFDPPSQKITHVADLTEACGEKGNRTVVQGKSHVNFVEANGKLYFATHIGFYSIIDGMEKMGIPPAGWKPYPGGHLLAYDPQSGAFENLGLAPRGEGILSMNMDPGRGRIFGLTWPSGRFFRFNVATKQMKDFGNICAEGENGKGPAYRTICRSIAVNPIDGAAWFTTSEGAIFRYRPDSDDLQKIDAEDMKKDYFGLYDPTSPGHMGYNWRQTVWHPSEHVIYGVHGNSGYLFRFDPAAERIDVLQRLTSDPSKRTGMFDQFSYGYLGFTLGPDRQTLHYLTGGPIFLEGKRLKGKSSTAMGEAKGLEDLHLVTCYTSTGQVTDHGAIFYPNGDRPLYVNSIAVGLDGTVYTLARITENGRTRTDLISFPGPLKRN